jgi:lauroyl/myristoyl acyltransferase
VLWLCSLLPMAVARALGAGIGVLLWLGNRKRRDIAAVNLRLCFPELDEKARARLLRRHYLAVGRAYTDLGFLVWASVRRIERKVRVRGLEHYRRPAAAGRRIILLVPHSVGVNFGGAAISPYHPIFSMFKPQRNLVADWLLNRARTRFGAKLLARHQGMRPVVRALKAGMAFYYLPDEDFGPRHSVFAPFFGVPAATLTTLGRLARLTDAVVVPCFTRLLPGGRGYEVVFHPPLADFPSGDETADAARMNRALEEGIRLAPEQYLWTLKFFKTRPRGEPSPYAR